MPSENTTTGWRPIETAPKDGTRIFLWTIYGDEPVIGSWCISHKHFRFEGWSTGWKTEGGYDVGYEPILGETHWQPIMAPPPEEKNDAE